MVVVLNRHVDRTLFVAIVAEPGFVLGWCIRNFKTRAGVLEGKPGLPFAVYGLSKTKINTGSI